MILDTLSAWGPSLPSRPRLLLVDDQPTNIHLLHALFRDDFDVLAATDGYQAIELCRQQHPDLVLLDVCMHELDGYEVCRRLKADPATREVPVIFLTGQQASADEVLGFELGAVDFITKPINPVVVRARVRTHVALKLQSDLLRSIAMVDGLTGVGNRRKFDQSLQSDWRQCVRDGKPLSLLLADVDRFKEYNDRYGHLAGDNCLRAVAQALKSTLLRPRDSLARYGGEEFVCLLPYTDETGAAELGRRMLEQVRELAIVHQDSPGEGRVSISIGAATVLPGEDVTAEALLAAADVQLYLAKGDGRACFRGVRLDA